jgi:IrrE N-terminal-like domain
MKNITVGHYEAEDLRRQVEKVIRGLGNPEPPLQLAQVRDLLRLDRHYYSSQDDSAVREFVSRVKVASKLFFKRPGRLLDLIRQADLRALWVPETRRILLDAELPDLKKRWAEGHEIAHSLAPWHDGYLYGDSREELKLTCHEKLESEANYGSGQLLFMGARFAEEASASRATMEVVKKLAKRYGNTITSTLWRFVEENRSGVPMVGIVSLHAIMARQAGEEGPSIKYCVESQVYKERFGEVHEGHLLDLVESYCNGKRGGPLGASEVILRDRNGAKHAFMFESFNNRYNVLTLGIYLAPRGTLVAIPGSGA